MTYVMGIDTGGTFTDGFVADDLGRLSSAKSPSTPPNFANGVLNVIDELAKSLDISSRNLLKSTSYIIHGTTSTLNALITGDVCKVGFITTKGHADSISIMNVEGRYAGLDSDRIQNMAGTNKPPPLVPRNLVVEINERIDYKGAVIVRLDENGVRAATKRLLAHGVEAIAISFLWSFRNPAHELRAREIIAEEAPSLYVALSSEISPRIREFSRSATTIVNTQIAPRLQKYLGPLEEELGRRGFEGALLVMQGSGGCVKAREAPRHAVSTLGSVLTGGIVGCTNLGASLGHKNIISTDIGGTTFLVGLVVDGKPVTATSAIINQYSISTSMVDVHTIGAGGGAIAWIDQGGNLRVGPKSAGARPGPACYGEGGERPTVTDADLVLGIINPDNFLGGRIKLSMELARDALRRHVAEPLGMKVDEAAAAVYAIQNSQTADLVRKVVVNSGRDPRDFVVYSFGGAGPVHCANYAADLGASEVIIPLGTVAAVFSAYGLASSDIVLTVERSQPDNFPPEAERVEQAFARLEKDLKTQLKDQALQFSSVALEREVDMRFTMQLAEVTTPMPPGPIDGGAVTKLGQAFEVAYASLYGKDAGFREAGVQIITYRMRARARLPIHPELPQLERSGKRAEPRATRNAFLDVRRGWQKTAVYDYRDLGCNDRLVGPAVVETPTTTVALPEGCTATLDLLGNMVIRYADVPRIGE
jgi:N-methylhydantoinase A